MYRSFIFFQAVYYAITGIWPLVSIETFMAVTGPKVDLWLVEMVGLLAASVGAGLFAAFFRKRTDPAFMITMLFACGSFLYIDVVYCLKEVIPPVYLVDAVLQIVFILVHIAVLLRRKNTSAA